jgi:transposase
LVPRRDLPERFGDFRVAHLRHSRWSKSGVWERIFKTLSLKDTAAAAVLADKAYDAQARVIEPLLKAGKIVVIPSRYPSRYA